MPSSTVRRILDVSHAVEDGMITYKGLPAPVICDYLSRRQSREHYAKGTKFHIGKIEMVANTGTYVDSPFHRFADGKDLSELSLSSLADLDTVVLRFDKDQGRAIDRSHFKNLGDLAGKAVLIHTGWVAYWRTDQYFEDHPFLTEDAARYLVDSNVALAGIDSLNIDDTEDLYRPVHTALLEADIPIAEHLRGLDQLPDRGARFSAAPVKVRNFGTFPVRAFAVVEE